MLELAKPCIDVGLFTDQIEPVLDFWQREIRLPYAEILPLGGGLKQHRHDLLGSVLKINESQSPVVGDPPSGYAELLIADPDRRASRTLEDPDGNLVTLVPAGQDGVTAIGLRMGVRSEAAFHLFYGEVMGMKPAGANAYRCGSSLIFFERDPGAGETGDILGRGYRYTTIQVRDCDGAHRGILSRGGREGRAPETMGEVARISFVRDPDANWIEISQRKSLVGSIEKVD